MGDIDVTGGSTMTNRQMIMRELETMSDKKFADALRNGRIYDKLNDRMCRECEEAHGGCPAGEDDCIKTVEAWFDEEVREGAKQ